MESLQKASELIFIRLRKCEKDFDEDVGAGSLPRGEGQHYVCQDKKKAFCQEEKVGVIGDPRETHK